MFMMDMSDDRYIPVVSNRNRRETSIRVTSLLKMYSVVKTSWFWKGFRFDIATTCTSSDNFVQLLLGIGIVLDPTETLVIAVIYYRFYG